MSKRKLALTLATVLLVQSIILAQDFLPATMSVEPASKVSLNKSEIKFLKKYDIYVLCLGLLIYKLDAIYRFPKDRIKEEIINHYDEAFFTLDRVNFDLENIDYFGKKGFTRYYPFYVGKKPFIIRIFRTDEKQFQLEVETLYEGSINNPPVTFQILRGVNDILEDRKLIRQEMPTPSKSEIYP